MKQIISLLMITLVFAVGCNADTERPPINEDPDDTVQDEEPILGPNDQNPEDTVVSPPRNTSNDNAEIPDLNADDAVGMAGITKKQCVEADGHWNTCGSPCAGTGADVCIEMCRVQCECKGIAGYSCPEGFKCRLSGKIADEIGVCIKED
jgi:hypothetical protein